MFVALVFVIFVNGQDHSEIAPQESEQACRDTIKQVEQKVNADKRVALYYTECIPVTELKKRGVDA